jgi:hypothetical protein
MYGEQHEIPYNSRIKERFLGPLSFSETLWIGGGLIFAYQMAKVVPPIGKQPIFSYFHYFIPPALSFFIAKAEHRKTGKTYWRYFLMIAAGKFRKRTFTYRRSNIIKGADRKGGDK